MAASPSPEPPLGALTPAERLIVAGAGVVVGSLLLPWYGIPFSNGLSVTGIDSFGFANAAVLLTVAAAVWVVVRRVLGRNLPRPLRAGALVAAAGAWAAALTVYLMFDRPEELAGSVRVGLRFGAFLSLAGAIAILGGGLRLGAERGR